MHCNSEHCRTAHSDFIGANEAPVLTYNPDAKSEILMRGKRVHTIEIKKKKKEGTG